MINSNLKKKYTVNLNNLDRNFFELGIFFLASAPFITSLLFLYPLCKGLLNSKNNFLHDRFNQILIIASFILIFQSIISTFFITNGLESWNSSLNWAGIANWVPMFLCYLGLNSYVNEKYKRRKVAKLFIAGNVPVLLTCIGQYWFNWYGPMDIFYGLIKWFQRPLEYTDSSVSGLFNNQNYTAIWLNMMWPLMLTLLQEKLKLKEVLKFNILFLISIVNAFFLLLTNSRNGFLGLLISFAFFLRKKYLKWFLLVTGSLGILIFLSNFLLITDDIREFFGFIVPGNLENIISPIQLDLLSIPRINIWVNAIHFISQKPFFGWGAGSFPYLYEIKTGILNYHTHNLFLEISVSFGLIVSFLLFFVIINILYKSFISIFMVNADRSTVDKGWWIAGLVFFVSHLYDVLIFDIRVNLASWIFFIGLRNTFDISKTPYLEKVKSR
tara:strand:+ start:135 stop:1457 length:1323 start_codon:yes stop_codon:yes gene_type:complete